MARSRVPYALSGMDSDQVAIDTTMIDLDGKTSTSRLEANAILAVALALAKAMTDDLGLPLYRCISRVYARNPPAGATRPPLSCCFPEGR